MNYNQYFSVSRDNTRLDNYQNTFVINFYFVVL